jgi:hypothetical protein
MLVLKVCINFILCFVKLVNQCKRLSKRVLYDDRLSCHQCVADAVAQSCGVACGFRCGVTGFYIQRVAKEQRNTQNVINQAFVCSNG